MDTLTALSPWSEVDTSELSGLSPRLDTLEGKTIGMFGDFMILATQMLKAVEKELHKRYPTARFSYIQYKAETVMIERDPDFKPAFDQWAKDVDCILSFYGNVPSSSIYLGYNTAYMEKLGKPSVMLVTPRTYPAGRRGCKAMGVPGLRTLTQELVTNIYGHESDEEVMQAMAPSVAELTDRIVSALTVPLTKEEAYPAVPVQDFARHLYTGTADEISDLFYRHGWTNGAPIRIPTREAVDEMLTGTDFPPDYVVGKLPPKMGLATVERIAINAVMAGCLPTYMPILIAAVQGALDPVILLEGWTCSQSSWGPILTVSGSIVNDIGLNTADNGLSPYFKANATIGRAFGYIMMNIAGLRPGQEDLSGTGHEFRLGFCMGDSWDNNPWGPVHEDFGIDRNASAVTMFWPQEHHARSGDSTQAILSWLTSAINPQGWDPGAIVIMGPSAAKMFADEGWSRKRILNYMVEYARHPAANVDLQWLIGNSHPPKSVDLPVNIAHSTRIFWTDEHMFLTVQGAPFDRMVTVLAGGGDHGGPSCTKIVLPKNWNALVEKYKTVAPDYIDY